MSEFRTLKTNVTFNARNKYIIDNAGEKVLYETMIFSRPVFVPSGWEDECKRERVYSDPLLKEEESEVDYKRKSFQRACRSIFDYIISDPRFDCFVTLTFNAERIERTSYKEILKKLNRWLDNRVRRSELIYILVPEYHADGEAIHFHGMMSSNSLPLVNSGVKYKKDLRRWVYNISDFDYGFSAVVKIGNTFADKLKTAKYMVKYITKSDGVKLGGRYYLHGGKIRGCVYEYFDVVEFDEVDSPVVLLKYTGDEMKVIKYH